MGSRRGEDHGHDGIILGVTFLDFLEYYMYTIPFGWAFVSFASWQFFKQAREQGVKLDPVMTHPATVVLDIFSKGIVWPITVITAAIVASDTKDDEE